MNCICYKDILFAYSMICESMERQDKGRDVDLLNSD